MKNTSIPIFDSIEDYNFRINIPPPRYPDFDIRDFEENMRTVRLKMSPFRIPFYQLALLESGGGTVASDGKKFQLDRFSLFFNLPGQIIYWDVPQNWRGYYLCITESFYTVPVDGYPKLFDLPYFRSYTPAIQLQPEEARMILDIFGRMDHEYHHPTPYNQAIIKSFLNTILAFCLQFYHRELSDRQTKMEQSSLGERFKILIHDQITALSMGLEEDAPAPGLAADRLFVSAQHLSETIRKELGFTPTQYINNRLVEEAKKLLRSTELQIQEIAYQLGFKDTSYFNRLFKKISGTSPSRYRNAK